MLRVVEHSTAYAVVAATIWWQVYIRTEARIVWLVAALATVALAALATREFVVARAAARQGREAESGRAAVIEAERLRQRAYDLCAGLRLGFDICEQCWVRHPDQAARELDRLRAAVGQFVSLELSSPAGS